MKILICGDSFAADWSIKYPERSGWCNWLAANHLVTNIAQAGAGEYKILKQVQSTDFNQFDAVIVSHASPNRLYCTVHPVHHKDPLHHNADLIYADIKDHAANNADADVAAKFYERYFDFDYQKDMANLCCWEILSILSNYPHLNQFHIENYATKHKYDMLPDSFNINDLLKKHYGNTCHLDETGNKKLHNVITKWLDELE